MIGFFDSFIFKNAAWKLSDHGNRSVAAPETEIKR